MNWKRTLTSLLVCTCLVLNQGSALATTTENTEEEDEVDDLDEEADEEEAEDEDEEEEEYSFSLSENSPFDETTTIVDGVFVGDLDLSGMTIEEADQALHEYFEELDETTLTVLANDDEVSTTLDALGYTYDLTGVAEQAAGLGQTGQLISRYKTLVDLEYGTVEVEVEQSVDEDLVAAFVAEEVAASDMVAEDATITLSNGTFTVTHESSGLETDQETTTEAIMTAIEENHGTDEIIVEATIVVTEPELTYEALSTISDALGTYSTSYSSSASGRKTNIKVAANYLNGTVLMPGESLSVSTAIMDRTAENGYELAGEYANGETVESYGGGVCQVATTLYNALLLSELQIDERYNHSMLVSYVDPSFDAAIATGYKDLVFTNNLDDPIYIYGYANGSTLTFTIYGSEYRASNRTIEYESVTVSRETSTTQTVYDSTMLAGTSTTSGSNHDYCVSYLQKLIYEDGELVETVDLETDYYSASHKTITIGTMETTTAAETTTTAAETTTTAAETTTAAATTAATTAAETTAATTAAETTAATTSGESAVSAE